MFPVRDESQSREVPIVTYTLLALNIGLYLWDRNFNLFGNSINFGNLAMRPSDVIAAITGKGDPGALATLFTSLFMHGSLLHLVGNMIFLLTFGDNVEHALGGPRFTLYYLFWGFMASAAHILIMPHSPPLVGASGAIGGVLGAYFLLFPGHKITFFIFPVFFFTFELAAWMLLGAWFLWQIIFPQEGVANWAHVGGFLAGMLTVLIMGGRQKVLRRIEPYHDHSRDYA